MDISFYENNSEYMQFLKTCKLQALSYYSKLDDKTKFKEELIEYYFLMERGKCTNNLNLFFTNIHKQIEILINSSITDIITLTKLKSDLESKKIKNTKGENKTLWENIFYVKEGETESIEYNKFIAVSEISKLSYTSKVNIFYVYFINSDLSLRTGKRTKNGYSIELRNNLLNIYSTNEINEMRNYYSHGNFQGTPRQIQSIKKVKDKNKDNLIWFYPNYLKILYSIFSNFSKNLSAKNLKL